VDVDLQSQKPPVLGTRLIRIGEEAAELPNQQATDSLVAQLDGGALQSSRA